MAIATTKHLIGISSLLLSLHQLSIFLNLANLQSLPWEAAYPDRVYAVEYQFLRALFDDHIIAITKEQLEIGRILFHGGLLFIYTNLRETPVGGAIRLRLLARLQAALEGADLFRLSPFFLAELVWVLLLGATASTGPGRVLFLDKLKSICVGYSIHDWSGISKLLDTVPALEAQRLRSCIELWRGTEFVKTDAVSSRVEELYCK